jgi:protein TonB
VAAAPTITVAPPVPAPVVVAPPAPPKPVQRVAPVIDAAKNCSKPEYPATSKRLEEEGLVLLRFMIDEDGKVIESRIETSSGYARLDEAARAALSRCQFKPGTADGKPERSWASLKYVWRLE